MPAPAVECVDFQSREVYRSARQPSYTSWVSFFPGEKGQWYLTCEEVYRPDTPLPRTSREKWFAMALPVGYDKSPYAMDLVLLESRDQMQTWHAISREPVRYQHSAGSFGQAHTRDGRFLRFVWSVYSLDDSTQPNEILYESKDEGKTWKKRPPFFSRRFAAYPHRLRMLRDGTLVLCVPLAETWEPGTDKPNRIAQNLNTLSDMQMCLFFSFDQGKTWQGPLPIYAGQCVSETDFLELPSGDLLFINNSMFACPGRQMVYRCGRQFVPGFMERVVAGTVPETVCLTEDGVLVGCLRNSLYLWSDDLGLTWQPLQGAKDLTPEMYQPWIQYLGNHRVACAGHYGADDPIGSREQFLSIHTFTLKVNRRTRNTRLAVERDVDAATGTARNAYTVRLASDGEPLAGKTLEMWYVPRHAPGYDDWNSKPLAQRMKEGGKTLVATTDAAGQAHFALPEFAAATSIHDCYQFVVRFNATRSDPDYKPAQSYQFTQYAICREDPPL